MANRKESAADITVTVGEEEVVVESLSVTKNVDIDTIHGSGQTLPDGYAINQVSYEGDMTCMGQKLDLEDKFFDENGIPKVLDAITITHYDGSSSSLQEILLTSEGYEMSAGETVETSFEFIAMKKARNGKADTDPTDA
ncbi:tail tube [Halorubrum tailed virus 25]|uniref:Tail tube n=1 Tax=Halorubrum tailed virus 25 TaxID=2878006 RepID=A0AAE8XXP8_9CAUD|nr:tail tube protein [Halorubrum tailed virus 25]UBF22605.1 tail tube [Halorubrum tailed virus 25]